MVRKEEVPHVNWGGVGWFDEPFDTCKRLDNWLPIWPGAVYLPYEHTNKDNPDDWFG